MIRKDVAIGNVCPARESMPHEPVMFDEKSFLWPVSPIAAACDGIALKICRHCGCIYGDEI